MSTPVLTRTEKHILQSTSLEASESLEHNSNGHTVNDQNDMRRMGKSQVLLRNFKSLAALSFTVILNATWEFMLIANTQGLIDGGLAGLFWSFVWTFVGFWFVMLSLAEMASMAPTSGGQYHVCFRDIWRSKTPEA